MISIVCSIMVKGFFKEIVKKNATLYRLYIRLKLKRFLNPDIRTSLAKKYLSGSGIEIGALHSPLLLSRSAHVKYVDRMSVKELR